MELFQTVGTVAFAEVVHEGGRSKGVGIVQFTSIEDAEIAIQKFRTFYTVSSKPSVRALAVAHSPSLRHTHPQRATSTVDEL